MRKKRGEDSGTSSSSEELEAEEDESPSKKKKKQKGSALPSFKKRKPLGRTKKLRKARKKKDRKILSKDALREDTKNAIQEEEDRRKRLSKLMKAALDESDDEYDENYLYIDVQNKVPIDENFAKIVKPHQKEGLKHIFDNLYESLVTVQGQLEKYDELEKDKDNQDAFPRYGKGCLIAHCMGLGKTLTSIVFLHTIMNHDVLSSELVGRTALVLCPKNVYQNWQDEIINWCRKCDKTTRFPVHLFPEGSRDRDKYKVTVLKEWRKNGGVMIMTYDQFKNHVMLAHDKPVEPVYQEGMKKPKKPKKIAAKKKIYKGYREDFLTALLDPGPDIVILDEAHIIKNHDSGINMTVNLMQTQRRLALTGTPMQNNLNEYYWMVNFCKPNLLGTLREYKNQYSETISRGQKLDATEREVQLMKEYSSLLYTILRDTVHRRDEGVLKAMLPDKTEVVLQMRLTSLQEKLYEKYMEARGFGLEFITKTDKELARVDNDLMGALRSNMKSGLFSDKLKLETLCFHPGLFKQNLVDEQEAKEDNYLEDDSEGSIVEFIDDDDEEEEEMSDVGSEDENSSKHSKDGKKKDKKPEPDSTDTYFLMDKDFDELMAYVKKSYKENFKKSENYNSAKLREVFTNQCELEQNQTIGNIRRLAYGMFLSTKEQLKIPLQFLEAYNLDLVKMSDEEKAKIIKQKNEEMNNLLKTHFVKELYNMLKRPPTAAEIDAKINDKAVKEHSSTQVKAQVDIQVQNYGVKALETWSKEGQNLIEQRIKQDAAVKAKTDALKHFDEGIGYDYDAENIQTDVGCKLFFCMHMMERCEERGEKLVIATQRMDVLDQMELALEQVSKVNRKNKKNNKTRKILALDDSDDETGRAKKIVYKTTTRMGQWKKDVDYFRIDGSVSVDRRMEAVHAFNQKGNTKARLMLLSTRAGGIGINLIGASRMILADVSFNPANDKQALFRIYRLGQQRTCRIYRLVADGTMEHAIFKRQVDKMHLSHRVVDEKHCERQFNESDLKELYRYKPDTKYCESTLVNKAKGQSEASQLELVPPEKDEMLQTMFANDTIMTKIANWRPIDSLMMEDTGMDKLTEEEKQEIWKKHKSKILAGERSSGGFLQYGHAQNQAALQAWERQQNMWPPGMNPIYTKVLEANNISAQYYNRLPIENQTAIMRQLMTFATQGLK